MLIILKNITNNNDLKNKDIQQCIERFRAAIRLEGLDCSRSLEHNKLVQLEHVANIRLAERRRAQHVLAHRLNDRMRSRWQRS